MDTKALKKRVQKSKLLNEQEQAYWLEKVDSMKEEDLRELESILEYAENIDWDKAIPEYAAAVEKGAKRAAEVGISLSSQS